MHYVCIEFNGKCSLVLPNMKAAVQVLKQADELKKKVSGDILIDNEAWTSHQQLQDLYQQLLVSDLEYALDKKVEQDLWNYVFKNQINVLQNQSKDRKNPRRTECQDNLSWFLEAASGFYLELLEDLCETFELDLPCRRKGFVYGITKGTRTVHSNITHPHKQSCLYICQHCLVHLGDIARYRNQCRQAEAFYHHAGQLIPTNGQPYNQLAILEAAKGDKLSAVFYYIRSIAVKFPFPVASTNLQKMFSKIATDELNFEGKNKLSVNDYISAFLQFHALAHLTSDLEKAEQLVKPLSANLMTLVATESLSSWKLVQMVAINLFGLSRALRGIGNEHSTGNEQESITIEEQSVYNLMLELLSSMLNSLLLLVYTMKEESSLQNYYALPVINLILSWLHLDPTHLKTTPFTSKLQIWPSLCKLLNGFLNLQANDWNEDKYADVPLPEDWDLQGFLPLAKVHSAFKFKDSAPLMSEEESMKLRASRLLNLGRWFCEQEIYNVHLMALSAGKEGNGFQFEAVSQLAPSGDLLKQLEEMSLTSKPDLKAIDSQREENTRNINQIDNPEKESKEKKTKYTVHSNLSEEKTKRITGRGTNSTTREKKPRQNVAMQTIVQKKNQPLLDSVSEDKPKSKTEGKQVTFRTPSPSPPASSGSTPPLPLLLHQQHQQQAPHSYSSSPAWANGTGNENQVLTNAAIHNHQYYQNFPAPQKCNFGPQNSSSEANVMLSNQPSSAADLPPVGPTTIRANSSRYNYINQEAGSPLSYSRAVIQGRNSPTAVASQAEQITSYQMVSHKPKELPHPSGVVGPTYGNMLNKSVPASISSPVPPTNHLALQQQQLLHQFGFPPNINTPPPPAPQQAMPLPKQMWGQFPYNQSPGHNMIPPPHSPNATTSPVPIPPQSPVPVPVPNQIPWGQQYSTSPHGVSQALTSIEQLIAHSQQQKQQVSAGGPTLGSGGGGGPSQVHAQVQIPPHLAHPTHNHPENKNVASNLNIQNCNVSIPPPPPSGAYESFPSHHHVNTSRSAGQVMENDNQVPQYFYHHLLTGLPPGAPSPQSAPVTRNQFGNAVRSFDQQIGMWGTGSVPTPKPQPQLINNPHNPVGPTPPQSWSKFPAASPVLDIGTQQIGSSVVHHPSNSVGAQRDAGIPSALVENFSKPPNRSSPITDNSKYVDGDVSSNQSSDYSLFSSSWSSGLNLGGSHTPKEKEDIPLSSNPSQLGLLQQGLQSLWSGTGQSPLEQLLEQQKRKREAVTK